MTGRHWQVLTASFLGWIFDGYESYALVVTMPAILKATLVAEQLKTPAVYAGWAIGLTLLGWGIGGLIGGTLADYVGRKRMMLWSVFLYALFTGLTALSTTFPMLCALRFLTGLAMGSEWSTGVALVAETWPNRARPKGCGLLQSGFGCGTLLAAVVWLILAQWNPLGPNTWRLMFVVGAIPAFFVLYIRGAVNESERWLESVRKQRWAATEEDAAHGDAPKASGRRPFTLTEILREPESRRRVVLTFLLSLAATAGWWAVSSLLPGHAVALAKARGYADPAGWGTQTATLYTVGAVVAYLFSGFLADGLGRRKFLFLTYLGCLVMTPVAYLWTSSPEALLGVAFVNGFFTLGCAYSWMAIYPVELFTSSVRSTAISFIFNAARLLAWLFPIFAGLIVQKFGGAAQAAIWIGSIYVVGLVVPWFLPETAGKPLPD